MTRLVVKIEKSCCWLSDKPSKASIDIKFSCQGHYTVERMVLYEVVKGTQPTPSPTRRQRQSQRRRWGHDQQVCARDLGRPMTKALMAFRLCSNDFHRPRSSSKLLPAMLICRNLAQLFYSVMAAYCKIARSAICSASAEKNRFTSRFGLCVEQSYIWQCCQSVEREGV